MRSLLFSLLSVGIIPPLVVGMDPFELCHERGVKLWVHAALSKDQGNKFENYERQLYLSDTCKKLDEQFPNGFEFGLSGFGDRVSKSETTTTTTDVQKNCFYQRDGWFTSDWKNHITYVYQTILDDSTSDHSNPLEGVPYIAEHYFGDYDEKAKAAQELRILMIVTDKPPRYSPKDDSDTDHCGVQKPSLPPKEAVSCDPNTPYLDLKTVFDKFDERYIFPAVMVYAKDDSVIKEWTHVMESSGFQEEKGYFLRDMRQRPEGVDYASTMETIVNLRQCDRIHLRTNITTTIPPETTTTTMPITTTTTTTTITEAPITTTMAEGSHHPTVVPIVTTPAGGVTDNTAHSTTTKPEHSKVPVVVGSAAAGVAALGALGAYRFLNRPPPDLDIAESTANADAGLAETPERETVVTLTEDLYRH